MYLKNHQLVRSGLEQVVCLERPKWVLGRHGHFLTHARYAEVAIVKACRGHGMRIELTVKV